MADLHTVLRADENNGSIFGWPGLGLGIATLIIIVAAIKCFGCYRRRARQEARATLLPSQSQPTPQTSQQEGPFRSPDPTQQSISVPPRTVYVGGRLVVLPGESQARPWVQLHYPGHVVGVPGQGGPADAHPLPRFNPEDLISFDATGDDKKNPCPICLGLLEEEPISTGQCLHLMHTSCLKSWLAKDVKSACPVCRVSYVDNAANDIDNAITAADAHPQPADPNRSETNRPAPTLIAALQTPLPQSGSLR